VLVVCGGDFDKEVLSSCGFGNVTISNLDERMRGDEFAPFAWSFQDAEDLTFSDESFDYVMVHAGLHHCASPHRALLEMYRVAREGIVVIEARDNSLMKLAIALGRVPSYEVAAVRANNFLHGGVRNSSVPNFIYRWTEREIQKTIASYAPHAAHRIRFFYGLRFPPGRLPFHSSPRLSWITRAIEGMVRALATVMPRQGNQFGFFVPKPRSADLFPWMLSRTEYNRLYNGL
jgi:SAM-dependent methyltransferase